MIVCLILWPFSFQIHVATLQAKPSGVISPSVEAINSTSLKITWTQPEQTNGYISKFELYELQRGLVTNSSGNVLQFVLTGQCPSDIVNFNGLLFCSS